MRRVTIIQGEHAVSGEPGVMISTLLGSCIAICLHDPVVRVGGMNHFLLGAPAQDQRVAAADQQRYGVHALELLVNAMMKQGASRERLRAHLYGGANMMQGLGAIGTANAAFARRLLVTEGIALGHSELGGSAARRVEFLPHDGKARSWTVAEAPAAVRARAPLPVGDVELF